MVAYISLSKFMVLVTDDFKNQVPTRKIKLHENIYFLRFFLSIRMLPLHHPTVKFNNYSVLFLQTMTCLEIIGPDLITSWRQCFLLHFSAIFNTDFLQMHLKLSFLLEFCHSYLKYVKNLLL